LQQGAVDGGKRILSRPTKHIIRLPFTLVDLNGREESDREYGDG
jgi:hypothetical protein|tara:strand:- start:599 stop:730 length:132 start_codon:yes stop_codon:yes gene_type:complete